MDVAFLKLYNNFDEARLSENPPIATIFNRNMICVSPTGTIQQKTNSKTGVEFLGGLLVELIRCDESVVLDITDNFFYEAITDRLGIPQIDFEFGLIGTDYYAEFMYLRITDLGNDNKYYSNAFIVSDYFKSIEFTYWHESEINGIAYNLFSKKPQRFRLANMYFNDDVSKQEKNQLTVFNGNQVNYGATTTPLNEYIVDFCDIFTYRRLLRLSDNAIVYIDNYRANISEVKKEARVGETNWFKVTLVANITEEYRASTYNWFEPLQMISKFPLHNGQYNDGDVTTITGTFNKNITFGSGTLKLYKQFVLINEFDSSSISISGNTFTIDLGDALADKDTYYIVIPSGLFVNNAENSPVVNLLDWKFIIQSGDWLASDWNSNDFLTD